jgi:hemoglobin
VLADDRIN